MRPYETDHFRLAYLQPFEWGKTDELRSEYGAFHLLPISDEAAEWISASYLNDELEMKILPRSFLFRGVEVYRCIFALRFANRDMDAHEDRVQICNFVTQTLEERYIPLLKHLKNGRIQTPCATHNA